MLTKLTPEQISKFWNIIGYAAEECLPPTVGERTNRQNNLLSSALSGKLEVWASYRHSEGHIVFEGIVLTRFIDDDIAGTRNLLIYGIYSYVESDLDNSTWITGLKTLVKYAIGRRCSLIVAYTNFEHIVKVVNELGGDTSFRLITFNPNELVKLFN